MAAIFSRAAAEDSLARALSRQIGYTTGAYSIERMAQAALLFSDSTAYQFALVKLLQERGLGQDEQLSEKYASEILNFVTSLGVLQRLPSGGGAAHLTRFGLTDAGVALRATVGMPDVRRLVLTDLVLQNDADAYVLTLRLLETGARSDDLAREFRDTVLKMREKRLQWLQAVFPNKALMQRIADHVIWIKRTNLGQFKVDAPKADFGRHHFAPRKSWALELSHIDAKGNITPSARKILERFEGTNDSIGLAPPRDAQEFLKIIGAREILSGPCEPALDLLRPRDQEEVPPDAHVIEKVSDFLMKTFSSIRLHHARQAPVAAARYFLRTLEQQLGYRISWADTLKRINQEHVERFSFFTNRQGAISYYQVRRGSEQD